MAMEDQLIDEEEEYYEGLHLDYLYEEWQKEQAKEKLSDKSTSEYSISQ